ncbi:MAG: DNA replication and repair protein RadC [Parcubacteria bacterium 33_209]|jgi:DNA repair protein RadC|nr:MAG: DNA replication and repair protein RadC [Parcubacteria bacterium 33_209]
MAKLVREIVLKYKVRKPTKAEEKNGYLEKVSNPEEAVNAFRDLADEGVENFACLYLNSKNQVLVKQLLSIGTVNQVNPAIREIFRYALACDAVSVIVGHNHPNSDSTPSIQDKEFTRNLVKAGEALNIKVLDHIVVSRDLQTGEFKYNILSNERWFHFL